MYGENPSDWTRLSLWLRWLLTACLLVASGICIALPFGIVLMMLLPVALLVLAYVLRRNMYSWIGLLFATVSIGVMLVMGALTNMTPEVFALVTGTVAMLVFFLTGIISWQFVRVLEATCGNGNESPEERLAQQGRKY